MMKKKNGAIIRHKQMRGREYSYKQAVLIFHIYDPKRVYILDRENENGLLHSSVYNNQRMVAIREPAAKKDYCSVSKSHGA